MEILKSIKEILLKKEINRYYNKVYDYTFQDYTAFAEAAKHFAEWGAKHRKVNGDTKKIKAVISFPSEDLEHIELADFYYQDAAEALGYRLLKDGLLEKHRCVNPDGSVHYLVEVNVWIAPQNV